MFSNKKKLGDQIAEILDCNETSLKIPFIKQEIEYFKEQKEGFEYEYYKELLTSVDELQSSDNIEYNILWLELINEIIRLDPTLKKKYYRTAMRIIFSKNEIENVNDDNSNKKYLNIIEVKINSLYSFSNGFKEIFVNDTYFHNLSHLKTLLQFLIIDTLPYYQYIDNSKNFMLSISEMFYNIYENINQNINNTKTTYLKSSYFVICFSLLIEILTSISLDFTLNINVKKEKSKQNIDYLYYIKLLFDLYLNINNKSNLNCIYSNKILIKIILMRCLETEFNEKKAIEWFNLLLKNLKMSKLNKILTELFGNENMRNQIDNNDNIISTEFLFNIKTLISNSFLSNNNQNIFFFMSDSKVKNVNIKINYEAFISKINKKIIGKIVQHIHKEYIYNGLFVLISLVADLIKNNLSIQNEMFIITTRNCIMKYIIKTNIKDMIKKNIDNINSYINRLIDNFNLNEKIWKELLILIKYYYFEVIKVDTETGVNYLKIILLKMLKIKINKGIKVFDENLFFDILNKLCEDKNNNYLLGNYLLYCTYLKNKFNDPKNFCKNLYLCSDIFIELIKDKYNDFKTLSLEEEKINKANIKEKNKELLLNTFANYMLIYLDVNAKYENKDIELFIYKNFIHLNYYFSINENLKKKYIKIVIRVLSNTNDINYYQCIISYLISLHSNRNNNIFLIKYDISLEMELYRKIIIKLIKTLSETSQIEKLNFLFECCFNRLDSVNSGDLEYEFLSNFLKILKRANVTKYNELIFNNKHNVNEDDITSNNENENKNNKYITQNNLNQIYFDNGKKVDTCILISTDQQKENEILQKNFCLFDLKLLFNVLINILTKTNVDLDCKLIIINFIKYKINDVLFFKKIDINSFIDFVEQLDKENSNQYNYFLEKSDIILSINIIISNICSIIINDFDKNFDIYERIINYVFEKINYFKELIKKLIEKYESKVTKNKSSKGISIMQNLLGIDENGMPNIYNLKFDTIDFKRGKGGNINNNKNYNTNNLKLPSINYKKCLTYLKSYMNLLEITINSLSYKYIKIAQNSTSFIKQIEEKKLLIEKNFKNPLLLNDNILSLKNNININNINNIMNNMNETTSEKFNQIGNKFFEHFSNFPDTIKFNNNFAFDIYKLFVYTIDFFVLCGEKYILKSVLMLLNLSFPDYYNKILLEFNKEFTLKYNNGKDFNEESIGNLYSYNTYIIGNKNNSINSFINSTGSMINYNLFNNPNNNKISKRKGSQNIDPRVKSLSVIVLSDSEASKTLQKIKSDDDKQKISNNNNSNNDNIGKIEYLKLIEKLIIKYIKRSKQSLKIFKIISDIINNDIENNDIINYNDLDLNQKNNIELFLQFCKWEIISTNKDIIHRNEDANVLRSKRKIKNYYSDKEKKNISIEESIYPSKMISIKSSISNVNFSVTNNFKKTSFKNITRLLMKSLIPESGKKNNKEIECNEIENILKKRHLKQNQKNSYTNKNKYIPNQYHNSFVKTSGSFLKEIKELKNDDENIKSENNDDKKDENSENNKESDEENENEYESKLMNDNQNNIDEIPNIQELVSVLFNKTNNNNYLTGGNDLNTKIDNIDKTTLYNEININLMYIINNNGDNNLSKTKILKFLLKLTNQEENENIDNEIIYMDNFDIIKYEIGNKKRNNEICIIYNNTLDNSINNNFLTNINRINHGKIFLYIFIIEISNNYWRVEFRTNPKKLDEFTLKLNEMLKAYFMESYIIFIEKNFEYGVYYLRMISSLLLDLMCSIKKGINDNKLRMQLQGVKNENIIDRINCFNSLND